MLIIICQRIQIIRIILIQYFIKQKGAQKDAPHQQFRHNIKNKILPSIVVTVKTAVGTTNN